MENTTLKNNEKENREIAMFGMTVEEMNECLSVTLHSHGGNLNKYIASELSDLQELLAYEPVEKNYIRQKLNQIKYYLTERA